MTEEGLEREEAEEKVEGEGKRRKIGHENRKWEREESGYKHEIHLQ